MDDVQLFCESSGRDRGRPTQPGFKLTYADFLLFPDDGKRHELIDGAHYVTPSPKLKHQAIVGNLYWLIRSFLTDHPIGNIYLSPLDVVLSDIDVVEPDLLFVACDQRDILTERNVAGPPTLVVEVLSQSTRHRDETLKLKLYERMGVREYWIVDPEGDAVRVYRPASDTADAFERVNQLSVEARDSLSTPLLPGLAISLAAIFAD